jgi:hypothetical protein
MWRSDFPVAARVRLATLLDICSRELWARRDLDLGKAVSQLISMRVGVLVPADISALSRNEQASVWLDWLGAAHDVLAQRWDADFADEYCVMVNEILRQHRVAYKFVDGELIAFESDELLQAVVEPALRLLVSKQFSAAHDSYLEALKEIGNGKADDAITDAGRALQEALEALGCKGDVLSSLIKDGKAKGLFRAHDQQLHEALILVTKWATSERNKRGDTHKQSDAGVSDAWLMVHVVGAIIVRLADPERRGQEE